MVDSTFRRCENVLYLFRFFPLPRRLYNFQDVKGPLTSLLAEFNVVPTLKIFRFVPSNELARPWFLHDVKKNTICLITSLRFEGDLKWGTKCFNLLKCFPQQRKFAKNPQYIRAWTAGEWGGKEGVPYHMLQLVQSPPLTLWPCRGVTDFPWNKLWEINLTFGST